MLNGEWRCSWSSADRRCSDYIWMINNLIFNQIGSYIRDLMVITTSCLFQYPIRWRHKIDVYNSLIALQFVRCLSNHFAELPAQFQGTIFKHFNIQSCGLYTSFDIIELGYHWIRWSWLVTHWTPVHYGNQCRVICWLGPQCFGKGKIMGHQTDCLRRVAGLPMSILGGLPIKICLQQKTDLVRTIL